MPASAEPFLLGYGVLGLVVLLLMLGILIPKWVVDEYRKREVLKDQVIERLSAAIERLADRMDDRPAGGAKGGQP